MTVGHSESSERTAHTPNLWATTPDWIVHLTFVFQHMCCVSWTESSQYNGDIPAHVKVQAHEVGMLTVLRVPGICAGLKCAQWSLWGQNEGSTSLSFNSSLVWRTMWTKHIYEVQRWRSPPRGWSRILNPSWNQEDYLYLKNVGRKLQSSHSVWSYSPAHGREHVCSSLEKLEGQVKLPFALKTSMCNEEALLLADWGRG